MLNLIRRSNTSSFFSLASKIAPFKQPHSPHPSRLSPHRSYPTSRPELQHFRRHRIPRWYQNPRIVLTLFLAGGGAALTIYYGNIETVPYTKRSHLVLLSPSLERQLGEAQFNEIKSSLRGKILPPLHPDSIRIRLISKQIIEAVQRGFSPEDRGWNEIEKGEEAPWGKEEVVLDDEWVRASREKGKARGSQAATRHLEGLSWEVMVVRDEMVNAMCLPGGKIIVFSGLLEHFKNDAEIATVIGHEVGHAIARHIAEGITKNLSFAILQIILLQFFGMPDVINAMSNLLLRLPFSRRMEMEADYIGLLLSASAGFDPRVAPRVYERLGQITGDSVLKDYLSTHPSSKKRAQVLSQAEVMNEALALYKETIAGHGIAGFL